MSTKEIILQTALNLFNENGINSVTTRSIATEMGISQGNLQYHYKNVDTIIEALFSNLTQEFNQLVSALETGEYLAPEELWLSVHRTFPLIYNYRFIFLHFVEIARRIPAIGKKYAAINSQRKIQFMAIIHKLVESGYFRKEIPEEQYHHLITRLFITADFWLSSNAITGNAKGKNAIKVFTDVFFSNFYPYLTPKGIKKFYSAQ
ncbi:TetR/AcrR family transcriptional regulator [Danxiaibacter flavus]|uniref:TetR/AcrR family transcriptional regulator n=1 Tax=Danxiaibacter flavus TaxID=3049108 RepID=A0ABV3ZEG5_9BACT|nr:TetR/AcrR family transcriptional regulator [Chitinophagaceae bacterium DXS]